MWSRSLHLAPCDFDKVENHLVVEQVLRVHILVVDPRVAWQHIGVDFVVFVAYAVAVFTVWVVGNCVLQVAFLWLCGRDDAEIVPAQFPFIPIAFIVLTMSH